MSYKEIECSRNKTVIIRAKDINKYFQLRAAFCKINERKLISGKDQNLVNC